MNDNLIHEIAERRDELLVAAGDAPIKGIGEFVDIAQVALNELGMQRNDIWLARGGDHYLQFIPARA